MSSAISTDPVRVKAAPPKPADDSLQPWQFFVLAALACATAVTFVVRGQGPTAVVLLAILMGGVALVAIAALRTVRPLVGAKDDDVAMIGERTRAALEREKHLTLRAIKDLEFDRAMGKLSEDDFREMSGPLRLRAARLIKQLDSGGGYRSKVEQDLAKRLGSPAEAVAAPVARACSSCATENDADARFCKNCGNKL